MVDLDVATISANSIKNSGINIVCLGVGPDIDITELQQLATDPSLVRQVAASNLGSYSSLFIQSIRAFCPTGK